ncbi:MAG: hypothetical protein RL211_1880 [Pseudomonadota bacterium]|jgi:hypothetical protein
MTTTSNFAQRDEYAHEARARLVREAGRAMVEISAAVEGRLTALMNEAAPSREMQTRRDAWTFYQRLRSAWQDGTLTDWQNALRPALVRPKDRLEMTGLQLVGEDVADNKIMASRIVLGIRDKVSESFEDLRVRTLFLEGTDELSPQDILRPDVLVLAMVERWVSVGMPKDSWLLVTDVAQRVLAERLPAAYVKCNEYLINQGIMPTIDLKDRIKWSAKGRSSGASRSQNGDLEQSPATGGYAASGLAAFGGRLGWGGGDRGEGGAQPPGAGSRPSGLSQSPSGRPSVYGANEETRMLTSATPLARARSRALGVVGQLKRLLVGGAGTDFEATRFEPASPRLAAAMAVRPPAGGFGNEVVSGSGTVMEDYSPAGVARVAGQLREQTVELKKKAETKSEKATIEIVALMFQAILQEERIPPGIRVWFARLQMPVLRVALAEPDFFGTLNHPARQLIDRMGSCVMGFDTANIQGGALELEIKRIVQVIEQYPETGKRVYQLVYDEFQKFLAKFLTEKSNAQKVVGVAQQVEQRETLTIQYTIEMRNMLKDIPVREEVRTFLFKVWAEVLAMAAVRNGPQHAETLDLKKSSTDLVWAASAKPNRNDRAKVIQDLPRLLQRLRAGMTLLGLVQVDQDTHIKTISDTLADAFLSKTQAIPQAQIDAMAERLANLEDFVSEDGMGDLPLDAESIELMLGIDASKIAVVADGGSKPTTAMQAWAQELQLGSWFTLDHNGQIREVQFAWRSERKHLNLFASGDGHSYLIQAGRLGAYLQAGLLLPQEEETLTVRATRDALAKLEANPERLLG